MPTVRGQWQRNFAIDDPARVSKVCVKEHAKQAELLDKIYEGPRSLLTKQDECMLNT